MRTAFIQELIVQARKHPDVFLLVGDLGYSVVEPFAREFPDRYLNAGIAEQNMAGVAAGLASEGYHPFIYSIANFPTLRCFEQIRNDVAYHNVPVTVVAVGAGMSYGSLGYSHHAVQDIAVMRSLPEITLLSPADPGETREAVEWLTAHPTPSYLRLGKAGEANLHSVRGIADGPLEIRAGKGPCALVATGSVLSVACDAAASMPDLSIAVFSCPWLQPTDRRYFERFLSYERVLVMEEHLASGGLASLLRDTLPEHRGITSMPIAAAALHEVGCQITLRERSGISVDNVKRWLRDAG